MSNFNKVKIFMETFGQEVKNKPSFSSEKINNLRYELIKEEFDEFKKALKNKDILEVADALIIYLLSLKSRSLDLALTIAAAFLITAIE